MNESISDALTSESPRRFLVGQRLHELATIMSISQTLAAMIGVWLLFNLGQALWSISPWHPLSHIPGPKLSAATYLPELYYDVFCHGRYTTRIMAMHRRYGPVVRISPHEVHCDDINFADEIYGTTSLSRVRDKDPFQYRGSGMDGATGNTPDHFLHRARRLPLARFFSRAQITRLEPNIHALAHKLCDRLLEKARETTTIEITGAYSCFTTDVVSEYLFGRSFGHLDHPDLVSSFRLALYAVLETMFVFKFFPILEKVMMMTTRFTSLLPEHIALLIKTRTVDLPAQIDQTKRDLALGAIDPQKTVFAAILTSPLPPEDKSRTRLTGEAMSVLGAGTETTSWTLTVITYHLLAKPDMLRRLTAELREAVARHNNNNNNNNGKQEEDEEENGGMLQQLPPWADLEKLPYLSAVLHEGVRLGYGVSGRLPRIARDEELVYRGAAAAAAPPESSTKGGAGGGEGGEPLEAAQTRKKTELVIPRGTPIGLSTVICHHDERTWPDSYKFDPERWLLPPPPQSVEGEGEGEDEESKMQRRRDKLISFSKGTRSCLGMNLAWCELHVALTALTLRVLPRMRLPETTTEADIGYHHDMIVPVPKPGTKGVMIRLE